jgi:hypothetical protein
VRPELRRRNRAEQRKGKGGGRRRGADRWGPGVSDRGEKEKRKGAAGRCGWEVSGPVGRWAEKVREIIFFFYFPFSNSFQIKPFKFKFKPKLFKLFHNILKTF